MKCYRQILLFGGNQNNVVFSIKKAIELLHDQLGAPIKASTYYESEPWGFEAENNFVNQVIEFNSTLEPIELLNLTQAVEKELGRKEKTGNHYESRPIDIDILFIDDKIIDLPRLIVPHNKLHLRRFTLLPLMDDWAELMHPKFGKTISQLLDLCPDEGSVIPITNQND